MKAEEEEVKQGLDTVLKNNIFYIVAVTAVSAFSMGWIAHSKLKEIEPPPTPVPVPLVPAMDVVLDSGHLVPTADKQRHDMKGFVPTGSDSKPEVSILWNNLSGAKPDPKAGVPIGYPRRIGEVKGVVIDFPLTSFASGGSVGIRIKQNGMTSSESIYPSRLKE